MQEWQTVEILLAEDSDADAEMILRSLRKAGLANKLLRVHDGVDALDFVFRKGQFAHRDTHLPKLIVLDVKMPRLSGIEVLERLKSSKDTETIPVVILTSSADTKDIDTSYNFGVNSYLVKPVSVDAFTNLVVQAGTYWILLNRNSSRTLS